MWKEELLFDVIAILLAVQMVVFVPVLQRVGP